MPSEQPREGARVHELKTLPGFIDAIEESGKTFEVRNNDRRFKTGDTLHLREYDPDEGYSGREIHRRVGYILDGFPGIEKGYCVMALEPAQPQPRGERDDLAARLEEKSNVEEGLRPARPTNLPGPDLYHLGRAEAFAEAAQLARASTHPEQSARVDPEQLRLIRNMAKIEASQSDPEQAPAFTDERRASHRRRADALNAVLAALEPASPTPTEQEQIADLKGRLERKTTRLRSTLSVIAALEDEHTSADTREDVVRRLAEAILCDPELLHGHPDTEDTTGVAYEAAERIAAELGLGVSEAVVARDDQDWDEPAPEGEGEAS